MVGKRKQLTAGMALLALLTACGSAEEGNGAGQSAAGAAKGLVAPNSPQAVSALSGATAQAASLEAVVRAAGGSADDVAELQANLERSAGQVLRVESPGQTEVQVAAESASENHGRVAKATRPYAVSGVSGAVLSAMLAQRVGNRLNNIGPTDRTLLSPVLARNGGASDDPALPFVTAGYGLVPDNYSADAQFQPTSGRRQLQMYMRVQNLDGVSRQATVPFGEFNLNTGVAAGQNSVALGGMMHVLAWTPQKRADGTFSRTGVPGVTARKGDARIPFYVSNLYAPESYQVRKDRFVPYGSVVQQWSFENTYVQLWLLKNGSSSQPELCWNLWLPALKRTYCQSWQVPAGWQDGNPLQATGTFVSDDRTAQGGTGNLYWQAAAGVQ